LRRIILVLSIVAMLVAFAAPAMARDNGVNNHDHFFDNHVFDNRFFDNHFFDPFNNNNGVFQTSEQDVESGDSSQTFNVAGGGDNSNSCQGIQGISNTGNAVNNTSVLQDNPFNNGFDNGFNNGFFNSGFNTGEVGVFDTGNFEISPSSTTTCNQQVNQAASASG
jgi:hypothetical protein